MDYYIYAKNIKTNNIVLDHYKDNFLEIKNLRYKNKIVDNLYQVDIEFIKFWENSIKKNGDHEFEMDVYSRDSRGVVRKHEFPRNNKRRIRRDISKMKKK